MTKIVTKLPNLVERLEEKFLILCDEFDERFENGEWIKMQNKDVYYINDIFAIIPNLYNFDSAGNIEYNSYSVSADRLKFHGFDGDLLTENEVKKCFNDRLNYFRDGGSGNIAHSGNSWHVGLSFKENDSYKYMYTHNNYKYYIGYHGNKYSGHLMLSIPIFRFGDEDYFEAMAAEAILKWLEFDLIPEKFNSEQTKKIFNDLKKIYNFQKDKSCLTADYGVIEVDVEKISAETKVEASEDFITDLKNELLNGDKIRAEIDAYDENILFDPNRGHWDLWEFGEGEDKVGEIILPEGLTARNPEDDINHGIVAIDFGTKSTVVVYEDDRLQILPLQVGNGNYGQGVKAQNYENPTVIQFISLESFVEAYKARSGRPKTKWNDVTVSHTAFENLTDSDSKHYYSFLTELKNWCGSNDRIKIRDRNEVTKDLPPFMELMEGDINPLEYYAYYLGLYINNMVREKRIFLKYIMSFPVTYDKGIRERMRRAFDRGIKKSLPTALLSNEEAMKNFIVQDGASEPAAYAITALQEYNFDPEGDEENYYAVFDFGGGTTDFDFGVFRESEKDRYDYSLIHFGENGDKTLGGENLLKLLAFEVFKANQDKLLNPGDKNVGKIPFTFAADKKDFVGSAALIKDSQEAKLNMHNLAEKLRPVWEEPDGEEAKKILEGDAGIEVELFTDKGVHLPNFVLHTAFENSALDLKKILRDRIEQGIKNFFIAMREAFVEGDGYEENKIRAMDKIEEISIFLAGNSSKSKLVTEIFAEYISENEGEKLQKIFDLEVEDIPKFIIYPALGTEQAHAIQKEKGVEVDENDNSAPTGKTGVAFGLLRCRDSGNVEITHITPTENRTSFQFYVGRNKKRKFKTVIDKNTKLEKWYKFIDAGNNFDILYSDLPEAKDDSMDVTKAKRINVTLEEKNPDLTVFIRAVKSNVIEYQIAANIKDLSDSEKLNGVEPIPITLT